VDFGGREIVNVNQCSGLPFTPDEVYSALAPLVLGAARV